MGMFDGLLGGIVGAGMVSVVNGIIEQHGGLQGVVSEFEKNGLGATVKSWVATGPNQAISPDEVHKVLGADLLQQLSAKSGLSVQELAQKLSQVLPQAVDGLTQAALSRKRSIGIHTISIERSPHPARGFDNRQNSVVIALVLDTTEEHTPNMRRSTESHGQCGDCTR